MKTLVLLIALLCLLGCGEDEEFPYNFLIGRWNVLTIRGELTSTYFDPIIKSIPKIDSVIRSNWHFTFEDDSTWSSVINFTGSKSNRNPYAIRDTYDENIHISGTYSVDGYEKGETEIHASYWTLTLETANLYSASDLIELTDVMSYLLCGVGQFSARFPDSSEINSTRFLFDCGIYLVKAR